MNRWKEVENSQLFLKQNLVRYNNFVREKQAKVADGEHLFQGFQYFGLLQHLS